MSHEPGTKSYIVCCKVNADKHIRKIYNKLDYDFTKFIVSWCLEYATNTTDEEKYICASCKKRLIETSNDNPALPYYGEHLCVKAGANLLKALQEYLNLSAPVATISFFVKLLNTLS